MSKPMQSDDGGEVGTQHIKDKNNLNLSCTLFGDGVTAYADMDVEAEDSIFQLGKDPKDALGFGWDGDEYDYDGDSNNGWYASDKSLINIESYSGRGVSFGFKDKGHVQEGHWVSVDLLTEGGTTSTRNVIFSYMHTWSGTDIKSISIATDGTITVNLEDNTKKWDSPVQDQLFEESVWG